MTGINTDAMREHYNSPAITGRATPDIEYLCDEIDRLRARLAEVEAERDARPTWDVFGDCLSQETKRRKAAEARLAEVEAELMHDSEHWAMVEVENERMGPALDEARRRLAEVEALCEDGTIRDNWTATQVLAAARGEG